MPLAWRRAAPLGALAVTVGALLVHIALFHDVVRCGVVFPVLLLLLFAVAARLHLSRALAGLAVGLAGGVAVTLLDPVLGGVSDVAFLAPLLTAVWGIGRVVYARGRLTGDLDARTNELRVARDDRARLEVATDRARLAGEGPQPGDTARTTATLVDIERESRRTLEEMRELVGGLRNDASDVTEPQPTLTHLDGLLVRAKGDAARLTVDGNPRTLPAGVELSAYRVVQEGITNALRYASGAAVAVLVRGGAEALVIEVANGPAVGSDDLAGAGTGSGLMGLRERVVACGGTLEAGPQPDGGWRLCAPARRATANAG